MTPAGVCVCVCCSDACRGAYLCLRRECVCSKLMYREFGEAHEGVVHMMQTNMAVGHRARQRQARRKLCVCSNHIPFCLHTALRLCAATTFLSVSTPPCACVQVATLQDLANASKRRTVAPRSPGPSRHPAGGSSGSGSGSRHLRGSSGSSGSSSSSSSSSSSRPAQALANGSNGAAATEGPASAISASVASALSAGAGGGGGGGGERRAWVHGPRPSTASINLHMRGSAGGVEEGGTDRVEQGAAADGSAGAVAAAEEAPGSSCSGQDGLWEPWAAVLRHIERVSACATLSG